ncbi:hypothetical protein QZH41_000593 [Actinostola sp. cb2023]|nr:hypothetical protein QZH41_000593 [Actinostola sp. cb2023]
MNYYSVLIEEAGNDQKTIFRLIDRVLHRKPGKVYPTAQSAAELANSFAEFFTDKIKAIRNGLPSIDLQSDIFSTLDDNTVDCQLGVLEPCTADEISKNISKIASKSCLLDPLPSSLLSKYLHDILPVITTIVNLSLGTSNMPLCLKKAVVTPLLKKPQLDHEIISNFRPVSNLPFVPVLGPLLYLLYTSPLGDILRKHNMMYHLYADDSQIYATFTYDEPDDMSAAKHGIDRCLVDINCWMSINKLKLNKDKTELLIFHSKFRKQPTFPSLVFGEEVIVPSKSARNIGAIFDNTMSMSLQINAACKSAFFHLRNIARIRKFLSFNTTEILIHALVTSKVDSYNALLFGLPKYELKKLQSVLNAAARLLTFTRKFDHITPVLKQLHWLPIEKRIHFKILLLAFKGLHGLAPAYISDALQLYVPTRTLRSSSAVLLKPVDYHLKTYGYRAFAVAAPYLWNTLPIDIRSCDSLSIFKSKLKTHLFKT